MIEKKNCVLQYYEADYVSKCSKCPRTLHAHTMEQTFEDGTDVPYRYVPLSHELSQSHLQKEQRSAGARQVHEVGNEESSAAILQTRQQREETTQNVALTVLCGYTKCLRNLGTDISVTHEVPDFFSGGAAVEGEAGRVLVFLLSRHLAEAAAFLFLTL